jgi:hypothetical protein
MAHPYTYIHTKFLQKFTKLCCLYYVFFKIKNNVGQVYPYRQLILLSDRYQIQTYYVKLCFMSTYFHIIGRISVEHFFTYFTSQQEPGQHSPYSDWLQARPSQGQSLSPGTIKKFLFSMSSRPVLGPTQPPIQWEPGALSPGVKRPGREVDHSPLTSAKVNKTWLYTSTPHTPSWHSA